MVKTKANKNVEVIQHECFFYVNAFCPQMRYQHIAV